MPVDNEVTGRAGGASWPAHCPELGSLSGQLGMMDGPVMPSQDERPWQLAAFLAQGQMPCRLLLPGLCPPSPPHHDSCRGQAGGGPTPVMVHRVTSGLLIPAGRLSGPEQVQRGQQAHSGWGGGPGAGGCSDHSWGGGHGVGVPPETAGGLEGGRHSCL